MSQHPESRPDRRTFLGTVARGAVASGTVAAAAGLLCRRSSPCGAEISCSRCALLATCDIRTPESLPADKGRS